MKNVEWKKALRSWLIFATIILVSVTGYSQSDVGSISGFVRDKSGAVLPNARVTVRNEGTNQAFTVMTDSDGHYTVPNLPPATYSMTVEAGGFQKFVSVHNPLAASTALDIEGTLAPGEVTQTVEVEASAVVLQTESGAMQSEISGQTVTDQQLNGRNPLFMGSLIPGMRSGTTLGDFNFAIGTSVPFNVNGARQQDTLVTFDGAPGVRTRGSTQVVGVANPDAIEEMQILTSDYQAEYGSSAGGQIRIVSKSGTRNFHASAYEYLRNSAMNANTWTRNQSPTTQFASPFRYNNFGFTFGGPVWIPGMHWTDRFREKVFFFVAEDWIRYRYTDTQTQAVPTTLMRQGNFSELLSANPWYATGTKVYDPATCPSLTGGAPGCVQFTNNTIPTGRQSANGIAIINAYPGPTAGYLNGTQNWIAGAAHPINQRKQQISVDVHLTDHHTLSLRRQNVTYNEYLPFDQGSGLTGRYFNRPNQTNGLTWTWIISPSMINEARVTYSLDQVYIPVNTALAGFNRQTLGINFPYIIPGAKAAPNKIPTVSGLGNFYGLAGGPYPSHSGGPIYTYSDSLTKVWGNHSVKAGFQLMYSGENDNDQINVSTVPGGANNQNGNFAFSDGRTGYGGTTGVAMANLAYGISDSYTEIGPKSYTEWRGQSYDFFAQDSWKMTQRLHVDYGLRFTALTPYKAAWGNAAFFDPASYQSSSAPTVNQTTGNVLLGTGNPYDGMVIPGRSSFPSSAAAHGVVGATPSTINSACDGSSCSLLFAPKLKDGYVNTSYVVQPRVGFAYELNQTAVLRGGFGTFATRMGLLDNIFPGGNPPFQPFIGVNAVAGNLTSMVDNPGYALNSTVAPSLTVTTLNQNLKAPVRYNWNLAVQQQLPFSTMFTLAYVGGRGLHNWRVFDINQATAGAQQAHPGVNVNALRPYQGFAAIQQEQSNGSSNYHSLQASLQRTNSKNITFGLSYTFSKSMDDSSNYRDIVPDTYNTSNLYGPSEYDARHMVVINYVWALPFLREQHTLTSKILGGWRIAGVAQFQTGSPCGIGTSNDYAGVGTAEGSFGCGSENEFWVMNGKPRILHGFAGYSTNKGQYFSTTNPDGSAIFTQPAAGTFNLQKGVRDSIYQPGYQDWNLSLKKKFAITDTANMEFTTDAYNFINHPNWSGPNLNPTSGQFGQVTGKSTSNPRTLQVGLHITY
ncbi:TonB-dependent Receptor Plug Domain [Bryocella elongata]|uniref:TonB-dependent Receptor Plug Domain n=1 Tax=Bryocella elongata TaxID=863522 RepID=A0A1H5UD90_9BACT|nr:carboxypeptidase regulatory-like domain-containing protein [Bryocella elongata]SEF73052.1 TonB-dependent Receptor Plug Domain [Bryocella elongata]